RLVEAEVALRGRRDAVRLVAVVVLVEVCGDDPLFAGDARVGLGDADRLDDLAQLAGGRQLGLGGPVLGQEALPDELLGDRGRAARLAAQRVDAGGADADRVD